MGPSRCLRLSVALALFTLIVSAPAGMRAGAALPPTWSRPAMTLLDEEGLMAGPPAQGASPIQTLTREEAAVIVSRALRLRHRASLAGFRDIAEVASWARQGVEEMVAEGLITGADHRLRPRAPLTRAAAAVMLDRSLGLGEGRESLPYTDAGSIPAFARGAVTVLTADGIIHAGSAFRPSAPETIGAFAEALLRAEARVGVLPGIPNLVAGTVATWIAPDDSSLAVSSTLAGKSGGFVLASSRLLGLSPRAMVFTAGAVTDLYAVQDGDDIVGLLGSQGRLKIVVDLASPPPTGYATARDASPDALFLSNGTVLGVSREIQVSLGPRQATLPASALVGAEVELPASGAPTSLSLRSVEIAGVRGTVVGSSSGGVEVDVTGGGEGLLPPGDTEILTGASTAYQAGGESVTSPPSAGTEVTLILTLSSGGEATAVAMIW